MSLTREDFTDIKNELDDRYVLQSDCNDKQDAVNKKFSSDDKRIAIISRHPPHGGCGLKYIIRCRVKRTAMSPSAWRVWIEISQN